LRGIAVEFYYRLNSNTTANDETPNSNSENKVLIYPNPANNTLHFRGLSELNKISIFDLTGKLCLVKQISNNQLDISSLKHGLYIIQIETSKGIETNKFVKQ